jgi:hypothetical protein
MIPQTRRAGAVGTTVMTMTTELQHAMARYEEARIAYRKAVLASLNGDSDGDAIREAIKDFQVARAGLKRADAVAAARSAPAHLAAPPAPRDESIGDSLEEIGASALSFFRRATRGLLQAG